MNRAQRRQKTKNRQFTKKGFTRVIKLDENNQVLNIPTKVGSVIHKQAITNVKKLHRGAVRGE